jgi:hypothetical protein
MKLIVDKVQYGIVPFGADYGNRTLAVYFKEVDGDYDYEAPKDLPKDVKISDAEIIGNGLFEDIMSKVAEAKQEEYFGKFLMGLKSCYFVGDCLSNPDQREYSLVMFEVLSRAALETQKKYFAGDGDGSDIMKKLRAPYMVYVCSPTYFTGRVNFCENFNLVLCKMPISNEWNQMALVQIGNHNFTSFIFELKDNEDIDKQLETIRREYIDRDAITAAPIKVFMVDEDKDKPDSKRRETLLNFVEEQGWRLQRNLKCYGDVVLDI